LSPWCVNDVRAVLKSKKRSGQFGGMKTASHQPLWQAADIIAVQSVRINFDLTNTALLDEKTQLNLSP